MLNRTSYGCDVELCEAPTSAAPTGIRNLGVDKANQGGMWVLPAFCPEIPLEITRSDADAGQLARFLLLAHDMGVLLPESTYTTTAEAMTQQFAQYARCQVKDLKIHLPLCVDLLACNGQVEMKARPYSDLDIYMLREPVERLNAALPGLGWFLTQTISQGHGCGLATYDPCRVGDCMAMIWFNGEQTDRAVACEVLGIDEDDLTDEDMEQAKNEQAFMPSDVQESFGGHRHLLGWSTTPEASESLKRPSASEVRAALSGLELTRSDRELVTAALAFNQSNESAALDQKLVPEVWCNAVDEDGYGQDVIGALAFVVWDDAHLVLEAVQHFEEYAMNGGSCCDFMACIGVELDEPATWPNFIEAFKLYISRYAAFSKLIGFLPRKE